MYCDSPRFLRDNWNPISAYGRHVDIQPFVEPCYIRVHRSRGFSAHYWKHVPSPKPRENAGVEFMQLTFPSVPPELVRLHA